VTGVLEDGHSYYFPSVTIFHEENPEKLSTDIQDYLKKGKEKYVAT